MSDVNYHRDHTLGLPKARELAKEWASGAAKQMGLDCQHAEGDDQDVLTFERMGVTGTMTVTATSFDLNVKLGMMMAAFKPMIEAEVAKNLGRIIDKASGTQA
ncbi:polyhydroxyalkanoic acid system family protein [Aquabacterium sp.]|jgi:putative polyhydroxyalkanoate system protein|uniref:polyhydroxyalkanoic acid system family protein n=1 Tax=Aquabacterium sp. TaxID=1872578 RepID=UPI0025C25623|nr:polyhydroxyalkanoic acid system family protein [Aquabacterium sp.]